MVCVFRHHFYKKTVTLKIITHTMTTPMPTADLIVLVQPRRLGKCYCALALMRAVPSADNLLFTTHDDNDNNNKNDAIALLAKAAVIAHSMHQPDDKQDDKTDVDAQQ